MLPAAFHHTAAVPMAMATLAEAKRRVCSKPRCLTHMRCVADERILSGNCQDRLTVREVFRLYDVIVAIDERTRARVETLAAAQFKYALSEETALFGSVS